MFKAAWGIATALLFVSVSPAAAQQYDLFKTYDAMRAPRSAVPIGARWIEGGGPTGSATASDNIEVTTGLSSQQFTRDLKSGLSLSIGSFFGLQATHSKKLDVTLKEIEIHRVRDLTQLAGLTSGQRFLYAAVKAKKIIISGESSTINKIKGDAPINNVPVLGSFDDSGKATLTLDGSNLFVAYQLLEFTSGKPEVKQVSHRGQPFTLNNYSFKFCKCDPDPDMMALLISDLVAVPVDGGTQMIRKNFGMTKLASLEFSLPPRFIGNKIERTSGSLTFNYVRPCVVTDGSNRSCFPKGANMLTLSTSRFKVRDYRDKRSTY